MPEWPDLHVLRGRIAAAVRGKRISAVRVHDPIVLRATRPLELALGGRTLSDVVHRGRFLMFTFDDGTRLVVNPMLSGLFDLVPPPTKIRATTAFALTFESEIDVRYRDDTRMGKVYLLAAGASETDIPQYSEQGADAGTLMWTADATSDRSSGPGTR